MAITNKEIISNQLKRINEKANTNLILRKANGYWYLCREVNGNELEPYPFSGTKTRRTSAQMIEYLAGLEDALDAKPQRIYYIRCEVNDHGWVNGFHHFVKLEDAIKLMRYDGKKYGILARLTIICKSYGFRGNYCAGQDYPSEIRTIQKIIREN